jgi:plastocyanin
MERNLKTAIVLFILAILIIGIILAIQNFFDEEQPEDFEDDEPPTFPEEQVHNVEIQNFIFSPGTITISQGEYVNWTNRNSEDHTVTSDNEFDSGIIPMEGNFLHEFNTSGEFDYYCTLHPWMTGRVIVE